MPNWNRIIVGDAFRVPSHNINYYRDLILLWPFLLFSISALAHLFTPGHDHRVVGLKCAALAILSIILAKEKKVLFLAAVGFCAIRFLFAFVVTQDWRALIGFLITGVPLLFTIRFWAEYKPSYEWPQKRTVVDLVLGLASLAATLTAFQWLKT